MINRQQLNNAAQDECPANREHSTLADFETALRRSEMADNNKLWKCSEEGSLNAARTANTLWKEMLVEHRPRQSTPSCEISTPAEMPRELARRSDQTPTSLATTDGRGAIPKSRLATTYAHGLCDPQGAADTSPGPTRATARVSGKRLQAVSSPNRDAPIQDAATPLEMARDPPREKDPQ